MWWQEQTQLFAGTVILLITGVPRSTPQSLNVRPTEFGHFLYVAFNGVLFLGNTSDDRDSGKSIMFLFIIVLFRQAQ